MLHRTEFLLKKLLRYLKQKGFILRPQARVEVSRKCNAANKSRARAFCHVILGEHTIYCADAIEQLQDTFVVGILLHEVGHLLIEDEEDGDPELGVDEFVLKNFPESGYTYDDAHYRDLLSGRMRHARNIEKVSRGFAQIIESGDF